MVLLISGHSGSGKTVLFKLCESHPDIQITDEFGNFRRVNTSFWHHTGALKLMRRRYLRPRHRKHLSFMVKYISLIGLRSLLVRKIRVEDVEYVLKQIYPDATIVGDCFTLYRHKFGQDTQFEKFKKVILYRDCRDVAAAISIRLKTSWAHYHNKTNPPGFITKRDTSQKVAQSWLHYIELLEEHRDTVYAIRYEDLVVYPQATLRSFGLWLGVDPNQFKYDIVHKNNIGLYKKVLSPSEVEDILDVAGPTMERLGYLQTTGEVNKVWRS